MAMRPEKSVEKVLWSEGSSLSNLRKKIQQLAQLNIFWLEQLDDALAQHTRVANYREGCLIIEVDSSVWATRLRFLIPELLKSLRRLKEFHTLQSIEWYVNATVSLAKYSPLRQPPVLSAQNASLLHETAAEISSEALKRALQKLARNVKSNTV